MRIILICFVIFGVIGFGVYKFASFFGIGKKPVVLNTQGLKEMDKPTEKAIEITKTVKVETGFTLNQAMTDALSETEEKPSVGQMTGYCRLTNGDKVIVQLKNGLSLDRANLTAMGRNWVRDTQGRVYRMTEYISRRAQSDGGGDSPAESATRKFSLPDKNGLSRGHDSGEPVPSKIIPSTP